MDEFLDKLRILRYSKDFCKPLNFKPLHRTYFQFPHSNPNEQYYYFTSVSAWLLQKCGSRFEMPGQFDDPNATASSIVSELKRVGISGDFGPGKLKQGHGETILMVLNMLADKALDKSGFTFKKPVHRLDDYAEEAEVDEDAEVTMDNAEEAIEEVEEDTPEDDELFMENLPVQDKKKEEPKITQPANPTISAQEWKLEVERVTPLLKVTLPSTMRDWRVHLEQMQYHQENITTSMEGVRGGLNKLSTEVEKTLEKISSREKYVNQQFESQIEQYRAMTESLSQLRQKYNDSSSMVTDLTNELSRISEGLDAAKNRMDDLGSGMTDSKPLLAIKQNVARIKTELKQMDLRIGVIQSTLLSAKLRSKAPPITASPEMGRIRVGLM